MQLSSDPAIDPSLAAGASEWFVRGSSAYRRVTIALFLAGFSTFSLLYCVQPLLPILAQDFGVSPAESSLALSLSTGFLALAIMCAAALSEGVGRRGLMFASMTAAAVLNVAAAFAPDWRVLLAVRAAEGFALGGVPAVAMAYLAEEIDQRGLGYAMGLYVGGTGLGGMLGRVVTGIVAETFNWRVAMAAIGVTGVIAALGFIALLPASRHFVRRPGFDARYHTQAWGGHLRHAALPLLFAIGFLAMGSFVTMYNYTGFRLMAAPYTLNQTELGLIFTVYLVGIWSSSKAGAMADRIGRPVVLLAGLAMSILGVALTLATGLVPIVLGIVLITVGFFVTHSVASGWVGRLAAGAKGHASSLYLLAYYLGSSIAGSAGGWFWAQAGWPAVAAFTLVLLALGLAAALRLRFLARAKGI